MDVLINVKVALSFSGGLDTMVCLKLLQEKYGAEVVTVTVDVGQGKRVDPELPERLGAVQHFNVEAKEEFVREYVNRCIKANGSYEGYHLSASLARYLIASKVVEVARKVGAEALAHGCTGKGNDQFRFDITFSVLAPDLKIIAPVRELNLDRGRELEYAREKGLPIPPTGIYSIDENLWGRTIEGGVLEDPSCPPPEEVFLWTKLTRASPERIELGFEGGIPVSLNGERMDGVSLITTLNGLAGAHGVGRIDIMEDRILGLKAREVYEAPAATVLLEAHRALEQLVLTRSQLALKQSLEQKWSELVYCGLWFDPLRENLDAFIDSTQRRVEGEVTVELGAGAFRVVARSSPFSLYEKELVSFETLGLDQRESAVLTRFQGLQSKLYRKK
jgi:argininosuccinate synthase